MAEDNIYLVVSLNCNLQKKIENTVFEFEVNFMEYINSVEKIKTLFLNLKGKGYTSV